MSPRELAVSTGNAVSIGRALDNTVCLEGDPNISRYHAVIDARADGCCLSDLGSSNGTTIHERPITYEHKLQDNDVVVLGGSSTIEFRARAAQSGEAVPEQSSAAASVQSDISASVAASAPTAVVDPAATPAPPSSSRLPIVLLVVVCVGLILVVGGGVFYAAGWIGGGCQPLVRIISPQSGTTVRGAIRIRVETENPKCIERVVYQLDGSEVARSEAPPYNVSLNAGDLTDVVTGNHILTVTVEDSKGKKRLQSEEILLAFEAARSSGGPGPTTLEPNAEVVANEATQIQTAPVGIDVPGMSARLATQISRKSGYNFDSEFSEAIRARTAEYRQSGYTDRAQQVRRDINKAYRDRGLEPLVGYVLAMSRSKLNAGASGEGVGMWKISPTVARGYMAPNELPETALADPKRSAEVSALYVKALIDVFEIDDFMYAVACFGMPLSEAGEMRTKLASVAPDPATRRDFSRMVKLGIVTREQSERVARFFAAGISNT
ncbi:MAG: FHA domain-containing protein, partial [Pyrinomonadaceae bacterium]